MGDNLADNEWHQLDVTRAGMHLTVQVDSATKLFNIPGDYDSLEIKGNVSIAGGDNKMKRKIERDSDYPFESFQGCLGRAEFTKGLHILDMAKERNASTNIHGEVTEGCNEEPHYQPVTFPNPYAYVKVDMRELNAVEFNFTFRTYARNGLLLHQSLSKSNGAEVAVRLHKGRITSKVVFNHPPRPVTQQAGQDLEDGLWHSVSLSINHRRVRLTVDGDSSDNYNQNVESFSCGNKVTFGASDKGAAGFVGCMYDIFIQGERVNVTAKKQRTQVLLGKCNLKDRCLPSPCMNRGRCFQEWNETKCGCKVGYTGNNCSVLASGSANCAELWEAGKRKPGYYTVNPTGTEQFPVYCEMKEGNPTTMVHHDRRDNVTVSQGNLVQGFYEHSVVYEIDWKKIEAIVRSSERCRQFIRYNCYNSVLLDSRNPFHRNGRGARWKSRSGQIQDYWGGAQAGSQSCACYESRNCSQGNLTCNCDIADRRWRSDEGFIDNKDDLPVTSLRFSFDGTDPRSYYALGKLECFGSTKPVRTEPPISGQTSHPSGSTVTSTESAETKSIASGLTTTVTRGRPPASQVTTTPSATPTPATTSTDFNPGPVVVIETPRRYITIRETGHQQLVTIVLSIVLVIFICAIVVLLVRQNLLCPCKCLQMPVYQDVSSIELGPSAPLYNQNGQSEIVKYEASPYHIKADDVSVGLRPGETLTRWSPDVDSDAETDRLDISNGNSSDNSETPAGFPMQNDAPEKLCERDVFSPTDLDLGNGGLTIMDTYSLALAKEFAHGIQKPGIQQNDNAKTYIPPSRGKKVKQERRMSFSDDESIADTVTSLSDQNNSFESITSINTRSWSDDGSIYLSDSIRRQNPTLEARGSFGDSDEYFSREDQFVEISPQSADSCLWVKNNDNGGQKRNVDSIDRWNLSNTIVARGKVATNQNETSCGRDSVSKKSVPERRQKLRSRDLNVNEEPDNCWNNFDKKDSFAATPAPSFSPQNKNDPVLRLKGFAKRDDGRQALSEGSDDKFRRLETEL